MDYILSLALPVYSVLIRNSRIISKIYTNNVINFQKEATHKMRRKGTDPPIDPLKSGSKDTRLAIPALKKLEELVSQAKTKGSLEPTEPLTYSPTHNPFESSPRSLQSLQTPIEELKLPVQPLEKSRTFQEEKKPPPAKKELVDEAVGVQSLYGGVFERARFSKPMQLNIMTIGEHGLGKSTFITHFMSRYEGKSFSEGQLAQCQNKTEAISITSASKTIGFQKFTLAFIDTPGYPKSGNLEDWLKLIIEYIKEKHMEYNKKKKEPNYMDSRVHLCLCFLSGFRKRDIVILKRLQRFTNVLPILAKVDLLTCTEVKLLKQRVLDLSETEGVNWLDVRLIIQGIAGPEEATNLTLGELGRLPPYRYVAPTKILKINNQEVLGKVYPWGICNVEDDKHTDFMKLFAFIRDYGFPDIIDAVQKKYRKYVRHKKKKRDIKKALQKRTKVYALATIIAGGLIALNALFGKQE